MWTGLQFPPMSLPLLYPSLHGVRSSAANMLLLIHDHYYKKKTADFSYSFLHDGRLQHVHDSLQTGAERQQIQTLVVVANSVFRVHSPDVVFAADHMFPTQAYLFGFFLLQFFGVLRDLFCGQFQIKHFTVKTRHTSIHIFVSLLSGLLIYIFRVYNMYMFADFSTLVWTYNKLRYINNNRHLNSASHLVLPTPLIL